MTRISLSAARPPFILVLDIGTSSLRGLIYDADANEVEGIAARQPYAARTTEDGGSVLDADIMFESFSRVLDLVLAASAKRLEIQAVACASLAYNVLGIDESGSPITPAYLYSDTRNAAAAKELGAEYDWAPIYERTGCPLHTGYLPARFRWLRETQPVIFKRAARWLSLHEYFLFRLFGKSIISHSFASWSGLFDHARLEWDDSVLEISGVGRDKLSQPVAARECLRGLSGEFLRRWSALADVPFLPAIGDGAAVNLGSGCVDAERVAVTVGTSGALRATVPNTHPIKKLDGLWLYCVDETRRLFGGSLNNGGNAFAYLTGLLNLPAPQELERELASLPPDAHGLTMLPFFAGERSPGYRGDARAALVGWSLDTTPVQIVRAALEAVAFRFALIYERLSNALFAPREIVASGAALQSSPAWMQIISDVLGQPVRVSGETEATARGAALLALEGLGAVSNLNTLPAALGEIFTPNLDHHKIYVGAIERQKELYSVLLEQV